VKKLFVQILANRTTWTPEFAVNLARDFQGANISEKILAVVLPLIVAGAYPYCKLLDTHISQPMIKHERQIEYQLTNVPASEKYMRETNVPEEYKREMRRQFKASQCLPGEWKTICENAGRHYWRMEEKWSATPEEQEELQQFKAEVKEACVKLNLELCMGSE
jgi:hypothetical protein